MSNFHALLAASLLALLASCHEAAARENWRIADRGEIRYVFLEEHEELVPHIVLYAETALYALKRLFGYEPSEPVTIRISDYRDEGAARATPLPHNTISLEIAPHFSDYEFSRFDNPYLFLISHELVHIVVGDRVGPAMRSLRKYIGKVAPVPAEPLTVPFSVLTVPARMTPAWHQEGIAVFMETWLNGGYGRGLGSFDEMYFRTRTHEKAGLLQRPAQVLDANTYLAGTEAYLYGQRFLHWLALHHGISGLLGWFQVTDQASFTGYRKAFEDTFGMPLDESWSQFIADEQQLRKANLDRLKKYPLTPLRPLAPAQGWVTRGHLDGTRQSLLFASFKPDELASIKRLNLATGAVEHLQDLPTPSLVTVSATAFDDVNERFFYTLHNDRGYRDLWGIDLATGHSRRFMRNARLTSLTYDSTDESLWGVATRDGRAWIVRSSPPYDTQEPYVAVPFGESVSHLRASPTGKHMAAIYLQPDGSRELIVIDTEELRKTRRLKYQTVSSTGSPESPAWDENGEVLYWTAYVNGVSNIFSRSAGAGAPTAHSNTATGLFHPVWLNDDELVAFSFTSRGFRPVLLSSEPVDNVAAIHYLGQDVISRHQELESWRLRPAAPADTIASAAYHGLTRIRPDFLIPVAGGFRDSAVAGVYGQFSDLLDYHRFDLRVGGSHSNDSPHWSAQYEYKDMLEVELERSPASFYDLVNDIKTGQQGSRAAMEFKHWWIHDRPLTVQQAWFAEWSEDISEPGVNQSQISANREFLSYGARLDGRKLRKSIGSVDYEKGHVWELQLDRIETVAGGRDAGTKLSGDVAFLFPTAAPHNVTRMQLAGGRLWGASLQPARFFLGGFGNRHLENKGPHRYREPVSIPGIDYRSVPAEQFIKIGLENTFPPLRIGPIMNTNVFRSLDLSAFGQYVSTKDHAKESDYKVIGVQTNLRLKFFHTLDSVLSAGLASAWDGVKRSDEVFVSLKLFRD